MTYLCSFNRLPNMHWCIIQIYLPYHRWHWSATHNSNWHRDFPESLPWWKQRKNVSCRYWQKCEEHVFIPSSNSTNQRNLFSWLIAAPLYKNEEWRINFCSHHHNNFICKYFSVVDFMNSSKCMLMYICKLYIIHISIDGY